LARRGARLRKELEDVKHLIHSSAENRDVRWEDRVR
jgi:hypothetical protein